LIGLGDFIICILIVIFVYFTILAGIQAFRIVFGFEMTPQLKVEETQLQMCILYHINDTSCNNIYGNE